VYEKRTRHLFSTAYLSATLGLSRQLLYCIVAFRRRGAARASHTYGSKYGHVVYICVYVYKLCQFDIWCVTVHVYFLTVYIQTRQMRLSAMGYPARLATEVPISTCCPIPTRPFGGLERTAAVHMSGRDLWRSKSVVQAVRVPTYNCIDTCIALPGRVQGHL
jgi:hypothetical protein